jgi:hypothetical protein
MFKFIFAFIIVFIFTWANKNKKGSWFTPSGFLLFIYLFSIGLSLIHIPINDVPFVLQDKYWMPMFIMLVFLIAFLYPFIFYNESVIRQIKLPNLNVLNIVSSIIIILSFYSIVYYLPTVVMVFSSSDLAFMRDNRYISGEYVETGIFNTIASVSASLYWFAILLFFIYIIIGGHKNRCKLLFISSISNIIHVLTFVGRDGVVTWIFSFIFLYLFFRDFLQQESRNKFKKYAIIFGSIAILPFIMISASRFKGSVIKDLLSYYAQGFPNGCLYFGIDDIPKNIGSGFPLFYEFTGLQLPESYRWDEGGTQSWVFGTFVKSLYSSLGSQGLILVCIFALIIFIIIMGKGNYTLSFSKIFIYMLYFQILSQGVFYFMQYTRGGNLFIILCFAFYFIFKSINNDCIVITKSQNLNLAK